jgi:hypothetical protein
VDKDDFVDEVLAEEGAVEVGAAFEEKAQDVAIGECGESRGETEASGVAWDDLDLGAPLGEGVDLGYRRGAAAEDQEIVVGCDDELGVEGSAEASVENDAEEWAAAGLVVGAGESAAVGEERVIGEDCAYASEDGVAGVAEELDFVAGCGAGEPIRLIGEAGCGRGREFAIAGERGFEGDERGAGADVVGEGFVEVASLLLEDAESDFDACSAQFFDALAADLWVGVLRGDDAAGYAGGDE